MKRNLKSIFILLFLFFSFQIKVNAFQVKDNQIVESNKTWTIEFTNDVGFDNLTKSAIIVTDSKGNNVNVILKKGNDTKSVLVVAPSGGYTPGENYILTVGKNAHSSKGEKLKQDRTLHFNVKANLTDIVEIKQYKDMVVYQGTNYVLPETITAVLRDGSTKILPVKWDNKYIDGSNVGDFIYYGSMEGTDIKAKINVTVKPMKTKYDLEDYLEKCFKAIDSPVGRITFSYDVRENDFDFDSYDFWIKTDWQGFTPYELEHSIKISDEDKQKTIKLLKEHQKNIASDAMRYFPNKKIQGGFFTDGYEYPYIHEGYYTTTFLTWTNYNYNSMPIINNYKNTHITGFHWFNLHDDYNFTGEPKMSY